MQMYCNDGIKKKNHFCGQQSHAISFTSTPNNCAAWLGTWSKNFAGGKLKGGHTNTLIIIMWQRWKTLWGRVLSNFNITNGMYHDKWIFQKIPFLNWIPFHNDVELSQCQRYFYLNFNIQLLQICRSGYAFRATWGIMHLI